MKVKVKLTSFPIATTIFSVNFTWTSSWRATAGLCACRTHQSTKAARFVGKTTVNKTVDIFHIYVYTNEFVFFFAFIFPNIVTFLSLLWALLYLWTTQSLRMFSELTNIYINSKLIDKKKRNKLISICPLGRPWFIFTAMTQFRF